MQDTLARWTPVAISVVRIVAALIFIEHGTQKLFGLPPRPAGNYPDPFTLSWIAGAIEVVFSPFLLVGLFTRQAAFILSGEMAFAYWLSHHPRSLFPVVNGGDAAILYCFLFLLFVFIGGGAWSLDKALRRAP